MALRHSNGMLEKMSGGREGIPPGFPASLHCQNKTRPSQGKGGKMGEHGEWAPCHRAESVAAIAPAGALSVAGAVACASAIAIAAAAIALAGALSVAIAVSLPAASGLTEIIAGQGRSRFAGGEAVSGVSDGQGEGCEGECDPCGFHRSFVCLVVV